MGIDSDSVPVKNATPKGRKRHADISTKNKYLSPAKVPKQIKEPNSNKQPNTGLKRSPRVPRVTSKYLEGMKAELRDLDESD